MSEQEKLGQDNAGQELAEDTVTEPAKKSADKPKKEKDKPEKKKKLGLGKRFSRFLREMKAELKKVSWPSRRETLKKTGIVLICVVVVALIVWVFDGLSNAVIGALLSLFGR